ncbi:MAG: dephospho-CoA kinase [Halobacteriovoraceae bacterium]|nr:dephospho-CoA kinase [Halobacteriovoraceae bacterium]
MTIGQSLKREERLHQCPFPLIGLTGGIGTGKSTVSSILSKKGIPVICADDLIHQIYKEESVLNFINQNVPESLRDGEIHFPTLRKAFFKKAEIKESLEKLLYSFLSAYFSKSLPQTAEFVVYDVPLLFEKQMANKFDYVVSVLCTEETQRKRVLKRDPETDTKTLENILKSQLPLQYKRERSTFVIENDGTVDELQQKVKELLSELS